MKEKLLMIFCYSFNARRLWLAVNVSVSSSREKQIEIPKFWLKKIKTYEVINEVLGNLIRNFWLYLSIHMQIWDIFWYISAWNQSQSYSKLAEIRFLRGERIFSGCEWNLRITFLCFMNNWKSVSSLHSVPLKRSLFIHEKEFILCFVGRCAGMRRNLLSLLFYGWMTRRGIRGLPGLVWSGFVAGKN